MLQYIHLAAVNPEGLFWLVVVIISIIAQIVKARRQIKQSGSPDQASQNSYSAPAQELEKFLLKLTGSVDQPQTSPQAQPAQLTTSPPPPPSSNSARNVPIPVRPKVARRALSFEPQASKKEISVPPAALLKEIPKETDMWKNSPSIRKQQELKRAIRADLTQGNSLRKAFVLKEILSQPLALRNPQSAG